MTRLVIGTPELAAVSNAAAKAWPQEACGLLIGRREDDAIRVRRMVIAANIADNPERRFEVDPKSLLAAHRDAREAGEDLLGSWHSHPNGVARPSATDVKRAIGAGEVWLIVPVAEGLAGPARVYLFDGAGFAEITFGV